jgi:hypothetical protein
MFDGCSRVVRVSHGLRLISTPVGCTILAWMIRRVEITKRAEKQLRKVPDHIRVDLMIWVAAVDWTVWTKYENCLATMMNRCKAFEPATFDPAESQLSRHLPAEEGCHRVRVGRRSQQARLLT